MISKISTKLAEKLYNLSRNPVQPEIEILQYGIECIINILFPLLVVFIYSFFICNYIDMIFWSFSFLLLRNYLGGYHAPSHTLCLITSCFYGIISIYLISKIEALKLQYMLIICCSLLV